MTPAEVVEDLNERMYEILSDEYGKTSAFVYSDSGHYKAIDFGDVTLWDDEDMRNEDENGKEIELRQFVFDAFQAHLGRLARLQAMVLSDSACEHRRSLSLVP